MTLFFLLPDGTIIESEPITEDMLEVKSENWTNKFERVSGMPFKELFAKFIAGTPIKRKAWGGYWKYKDEKITIYLKDGSVLDFANTKQLKYTLSNVLEDDWEIATNENCIIEVK